MVTGKKNIIMLIVVVVSLLAAGAITFCCKSSNSSLDDLAGQMQWIKCRECGATFEMDKKDFYIELEKSKNPDDPMSKPRLACKKCGKKSILKAVKCEKCDEIFFEGACGPEEFKDKCPKCKYSKNEELRKP